MPTYLLRISASTKLRRQMIQSGLHWLLGLYKVEDSMLLRIV